MADLFNSSPRIVITGSRFWEDEVIIAYAIEQARKQYGNDAVIIQGECPYGGADLIAKEYAKKHGYEWESFYPEFDNKGKVKGPERNKAMLRAGADIVLAFPLDSSRGTINCIALARQVGIPVKIYEPGFDCTEDITPNECRAGLRIHFDPHRKCVLR